VKTGIAGRIAQAFIDSKLTPLLMLSALLVGFFGVVNTPREEEPQIVVPLVDIFVPYPGATAAEIEERVTKPLEKIISQIQGVEYIYSMSRPDFAVITVRYVVGENMEDSLVKLWATILKNMDRKPAGVEFPLLKTTSIDDVPVLAFTLWSEKYDAYSLRQVGAVLADEIKKIDNVAEVEIEGGLKRQVRVILDQAKLEAHGITPLQVAHQIQTANQQLTAGSVQRLNTEYIVRTGGFLEDAQDVAGLVVGVSGSHPVYLRDVAEIVDGPEEVSNYVFHGVGPSSKDIDGEKDEEYQAVTLGVAKRKGSDAMRVASQVMKKIEALEGTLIPADIHVVETRNYGETASEKVFKLLEHLLAAIVAVTIVVGLVLGWRGGLVVFATVPITFALTLFVYYLFGYTLNRVTLFALIFVTGIVVDDSIIVAENIHRHFAMRRLPKLQAAIAAISEVGNPTILATFTVIASVLPMAFVSGLMGPYMSPMPIGASLATLFSLLVALIGTPWLAFRLLKEHGHEEEYRLEDTNVFKFYQKTLTPVLHSGKRSWGLIGFVTGLLLVSVSLFFFRAVEVKILPYDNKSEMQVIIDMPEGTTLEQTARVAKEIAGYVRTVPEVKNYQYYVGTNAPINFNGLVRHYYLRSGSNVADIQVNLVHKGERKDQSHDIAKRIRPEIQKIAAKYGARVKVAEVPPGPPVLSTLVAEIYGPNYEEQIELARKVRDIFDETDGVVDVDWYVEDDQKVFNLVVDKEKAALRGVSTDQVAMSLRMAVAGAQVALLRAPNELEPVGIELRLARANRTSMDDLGSVYVRNASNQLIPIADLVQIREQTEEKAIYRKNLQRVVYVTGDVAGVVESPIYAMLEMNKKIGRIEVAGGQRIEPLYTRQPFLEEDLSLKWDGEWQITYEVFRDLGGAFAVVLVIIYLLTIGWFQSFKTPLVMMIAIPLSLVGIIPGHWIHGAFFTATSMIGMIALAGIMVRNSVLLIDFIELRRAEGGSLERAVIEAGAVRTRPILLTAGTVVIGAIVILFDPIFQGLAISLMWGGIASTILTLGVVPVVYYMIEKRKLASAAAGSGEASADKEDL
jgi:multidrug efflux pump subunit AcrB